MTTDSLQHSLDQSWDRLMDGASPGKSPYSMVQLATVGLDGAPRVRTVVVRITDRATRTVAFHTDLRSPKIAEMQAEPRVTIIGYDMDGGQQIRLAGVAQIHNADSVALAAWGASRTRSLICYHSDLSPGAVLDDPTLADQPDPAPEDLHLGLDRFCRVNVTVEEIDWLDLAATGHRRVRHVWAGDEWRSDWLAP